MRWTLPSASIYLPNGIWWRVQITKLVTMFTLACHASSIVLTEWGTLQTVLIVKPLQIRADRGNRALAQHSAVSSYRTRPLPCIHSSCGRENNGCNHSYYCRTPILWGTVPRTSGDYVAATLGWQTAVICKTCGNHWQLLHYSSVCTARLPVTRYFIRSR
jgi:hypothetical protein